MPSLTALCRARGIPDLRQRLRVAGMLTLEEIAGEHGVTTDTIKRWQRRRQISGRRIDGRRAHLYHPRPDPPRRPPPTPPSHDDRSRPGHPS